MTNSWYLRGMFSISLIRHSHKKWKDNLEGSLVWVIFMAELVPTLPQNTSIVNIESTCKSKQQYYLCEQLLWAQMYLHFINLFLIDFVWYRLCNKCLLLFENSTRSITLGKNIVAVITQRQIENKILYICRLFLLTWIFQ